MIGRDLFKIVFTLEAFHAAGGIDEFLLAGKERMAGGADFHPDVIHGGTGLKGVAARARNRGQIILGMNFFFHVSILRRWNR